MPRLGARARGAVATGALTMLGVALRSAAPLAAAACEGHECDPHWVDYGCASSNVDPSDPCCEQGFMIDDDTWATTREGADWLTFESYEQLRLHLSAWTGDRVPEEGKSSIWIAPAGPPDAPLPANDPTDATVGTTTLASGNLGEFLKIDPGIVVVENATCSPQLVRVVVGFPSLPTGTKPAKGPCWLHQDAANARDGGKG